MKNTSFEMPKWTGLVVIAPFLSAYLWKFQIPNLHSLTFISPYVTHCVGILICAVIAFFILKKGYLGSAITFINYLKTLFVSVALFYGTIAFSFLAINYYIRWPIGQEIVSPIKYKTYISQSFKMGGKCRYIEVAVELNAVDKIMQFPCKTPIEQFTKVRFKKSRGLFGFSVLYQYELVE